MERKSEHFVEDPTLRKNFVNQVSWDEWASINAPNLLLPNVVDIVEREIALIGGGYTVDDVIAEFTARYVSTLDLNTNMAEALYLLGHDRTERLVIIDNEHAELLRRSVEAGLITERQSDIDFRAQFGV
jgi:hypothetical protein